MISYESPVPPIVAICYDFDKTLSPEDMQAQGFIQAVGYSVEDFWRQTNDLAQANDMDPNLAYMYKMIQSSAFTRKTLASYGAGVSLFKGVRQWFGRINRFGEERGVSVEHYVISSGLKEMIEGTPIASCFKRIYASSFFYGTGDGIAVWPAQVVNYTGKTQYLFRIEKGVLEVNDLSVNEVFPSAEIRIPFRNIIYIGDSDTDVPCMKLVRSRGGYSVGVYDQSSEKVLKMIRDGRIDYYAPADYSEGGHLDELIKMIIGMIACRERLSRSDEMMSRP